MAKESIVDMDWTGRLQVYSCGEYLNVRSLAHQVKEGRKDAIEKAAIEMAKVAVKIPNYQDYRLVPMPGHEGKPTYTLDLALELASLTANYVCDFLRSTPGDTLYEQKRKNGIEGLRPDAFETLGHFSLDYRPIFIDNVLDTGTTAMSAFKAVGGDAILLTLGSTTNYKKYNYPIDVKIFGPSRKPRNLLRAELITAIDDAMAERKYEKYMEGGESVARFYEEIGLLKDPPPETLGLFLPPNEETDRTRDAAITLETDQEGRIRHKMTFYNHETAFIEDIDDKTLLQDTLEAVKAYYYNEKGKVESTIGNHQFEKGDEFILNRRSYVVQDKGTFMTTRRPFIAKGLKTRDEEGNEKVFLLNKDARRRIFVMPQSEREKLKDMRGIEENKQTEETDNHYELNTDIMANKKDTEKQEQAQQQAQAETAATAKTANKEKEKAKRQETEVKEEPKQEQKEEKEENKEQDSKQEQEKEKEQKDDKEEKSIGGAAVQTMILVNMLQYAKENDGVFVNVARKQAPKLYGEDVQLSPYNNLLLSMHSDLEGFRTNQYTSFEKAKTAGINVMGGEKGIPLSWLKWDKYVNQYDKTDTISHEDYMKLPDDTRANYKAVPQREYRYLYNIDQTILPVKDKEAYLKTVEESGAPGKEIITGEKETALDKNAKTFDILKIKHPGSMLLYRNGDNYEMYNEDADRAHEILSLKISDGKDRGFKQMASFPHGQLDTNLPKMIRAGQRVVIIDRLQEIKDGAFEKYLSDKEKEDVKGVETISGKLSEALGVKIRDAAPVLETHYDANEDSIQAAPVKAYDSYERYAHDLFAAFSDAMGAETRMNRVQRGSLGEEDAKKQEGLVRELVAGSLMTGLGMQSVMGKQSAQNIDYWQRELKEDPKFLERVERDVNQTLESVDRIMRGETVDFSKMRGEKAAVVDMPGNYSIVRELSQRADAERKEIVIVADKEHKSADVILPAGASKEPGTELPGLNKGRIANALKKEGFDADKILFHNNSGALGLRQPNEYFAGKEVTVNRLKRFDLIPVTKLDVSPLVHQKADIEKMNMFTDKDNNYAIYIKPRHEPAITMYPSKDDISLFFRSLKEQDGAQVRGDLAQKYYRIAAQYPELKKDLLTIDTGDADISRISKVNLFKKDEGNKLMMVASIDGQRQPLREVSKADWNRFWLADDKDLYKTQLAAKMYSNELSRGREVPVEKQEQEQAQEVRQGGFRR